jgi:hypothetical protein
VDAQLGEPEPRARGRAGDRRHAAGGEQRGVPVQLQRAVIRRVLGALLVTAIPRRRDALPREHVVDATRAGGRFVANSPVLLASIAPAAAFAFPAGATWALLPLVARDKLALGSDGYGLLLGCVGLGAIGAATLGAALRRRLAPAALYVLCAAVVAATTAAVDAVVLVAAGGAWIVCLGLLGASYQSAMPAWAKARGMAYYLIAMRGSTGIGGLAFGAIAELMSLDAALMAVAATLAAGAVTTSLLPLPRADRAAADARESIPLPPLDARFTDSGPVLVTVRWRVRHDAIPTFVALAAELRRTRRRTGALRWRLYRAVDAPADFAEGFVVASWASTNGSTTGSPGTMPR